MALRDWLDRYTGTYSQRELARARQLLARIEQLGKTLEHEPDVRLGERVRALRQRATRGEQLDRLLVETFALVREVADRQVGLRHFDVQIFGGVVLHRGNIAEMKTGEGKTLVATLPVVLRALSGKGVHVVTVNDYLAARDARWMGPVYEFLGLSVGVVTEDMDPEEDRSARKAGYEADVTYVTNHELVFDYLRDHLAVTRDDQVHRPFHFALVDEVDLLLLDEAGTPLIISGAADSVSEMPAIAHEVVAPLREGEHFVVDHRTRKIAIEESGWLRMERTLKVGNLASAENLGWQHALYNALLAHGIYRRDVDYIVRDDRVFLVDEHTGRVSPDKRLADGLHQALEAKEGVLVRPEDRTLARVSYQTFFRLYPALCGMTGTAYSARHELARTYGLRTVVIPPNRPVMRTDHPALVFRSSSEKLEALSDTVSDWVEAGRPVLVGTTSVRESEQVSRRLSERGVDASVLNAKDDTAEAAIIAEAGRSGAVTVSTNMAGRGVDIVLGGSPRSGQSHGAERAQVVAAGGLMVIGTGLHDARRIDEQLRGRAGRQGDPGGSRYFLSLDDPIYRRFGRRDRGAQVLTDLRAHLRDHPRGRPIRDRWVLRTLKELRRKVELQNEAIRTDVLRYDVVVDRQRSTIYAWRQTVLEQRPDEMVVLLGEMTDELFGDAAGPLASPDAAVRQEARDRLLATAGEVLGDLFEEEQLAAGQVIESLKARIRSRITELRSAWGDEGFAAWVGPVVLSTIDEMWTEHLGALEQIEDAVGLRGYAELDPLVEFAKEAHHAYEELLRRIRKMALSRVLQISGAP